MPQGSSDTEEPTLFARGPHLRMSRALPIWQVKPSKALGPDLTSSAL